MLSETERLVYNTSLCTMPPPPPRSDEAYSSWMEALKSMNGVGLLKIMLDEVSKIPFKDKRKFGTKSDSEIVQMMIQEMNDILMREFLHVDFSATQRDIAKQDWETLQSCKRSESGTVGTIFLQCLSGGVSEIVVAKAVMVEDFEKTNLVNRIATKFFGIKCPAVRFIPRTDPEFSVLESAVKKLFLPLNEELYNMGGHLSPKDLFSSHGVLLLEYVRGKPLCHRTQGQRALTLEDYHTLGRLFLLDLLIRNTDRLPCARAMPRPGHGKLLSDHGNAGNIMFGSNPGEVWSIDPEMQVAVDETIEALYGAAVEAVVEEITQQVASIPCFQALDALFYAPIPGLKGIIDVSINELRHWSSLPAVVNTALSGVLDMIRLRAHVDFAKIGHRTMGNMPPETNEERAWREWMRLASPRAIADVLQFLELHTGYSTPKYADQAFSAGFEESLQAAAKFKVEYESASVAVVDPQIAPSDSNPSADMEFIMRMITRATQRLGPSPNNR